MSTASPLWQSHYHIMLLHAVEPSVLLFSTLQGWCLPSFQREGLLSETEESSHLLQINNAMRRQLELTANVLYCVYQRVDDENARQELMYVLEIRDPSWLPPADSQWVGYDTLTHLKLVYPEQRSSIATCLREMEEVPPLRQPWARRGWFAEAELWIQEQLARLNYSIVAPIEQVRTWCLSCILRVPTTYGNAYLKAISTDFLQKNTSISFDAVGKLPLLFTHEPMLIQSLSARYLQNMPTLLAIESERCWMLLTEFGAVLYTHPDKTVWEKALVGYAHIQVESTQHIDSLFAIGCLDRRLNILETQIDPLLHDESVLADLDRSEIEQLRSYGPQLKAMCQQLAQYPIPQTLVHGDLHTGNIAVQNDNIIYFDWTDGCVAHPFFDAFTFLNDIDNPVEQKRLRDSYLIQWIEYASLESMHEIFPLSQMLAAVHQAVSYQHIMANVEDAAKPNMRGGATYWLRKLFQLLAGHP